MSKTVRLFAALLILSISPHPSPAAGIRTVFKARHKRILIHDADMDPSTGKLTVAVPVEYQPETKVWLNGKELRINVDFRVTLGGIFPLPGPYRVEWMVHRSRHRVEF